MKGNAGALSERVPARSGDTVRPHSRSLERVRLLKTDVQEHWNIFTSGAFIQRDKGLQSSNHALNTQQYVKSSPKNSATIGHVTNLNRVRKRKNRLLWLCQRNQPDRVQGQSKCLTRGTWTELSRK